MIRIIKRGGMYYIERKRWLLGWCQQFDRCIDGCMVPTAFFNEAAARGYCAAAVDAGRHI